MKKLLPLFIFVTGISLFSAPTAVLDGSSDEALTRSFIALWQSLDNKTCDELGCAVTAAAEKLAAMSPAEREKLLNGKTAEDFINTAKQLSPQKYEENMAIHARFDDGAKATNSKAIHKTLTAIKPEKGFGHMLIMTNYVFGNSESGPVMRLISDELQTSSDEQVAEYAAMRAVRRKNKGKPLGDQLLNINLCQDNHAAVAKAKELAPAEFDAALKEIMADNPNGKLTKFAGDVRNAQAEMVQKFDAWSVIYNLDWMTDFEAAKQRATAENKPMFVIFIQSDAWPPSKLESELLSASEFAEFAADRLVLVYVDFPEQEALLYPEQAAANKSLAEKYGVSRGKLPTVFLMDAQGNVTGKTGYCKMPPKRYVKRLEKTLE